MTIFRLISFLEGLSYLIILSVSAGFISRDYVFHLGMTHGVLFVLYFVLSLYTSHKQGWSLLKWLAVFLVSIVPFAFIGLELYLRKTLDPKHTDNIS
jgi:integral membrane protein